MKNRTELARYFKELGFSYGAEIGVCFGYFSEILCRKIPNLKLLAIDNWNNDPSIYREKTLGIPGEEATRKKLSPYNVTIIKKNSLEAAKDIPDESLDFVYIDAEHTYEAVLEDIRAWSKKVKKGGIVSGHDYYVFKSGNQGVINAVDEYVGKHKYVLKLTQWDLKNPVRDDRQPSWYFLKK